MRSTAMLCISTLDGARDHTPLDTQYLSHLRDEIGVVDPIEMVDLVSMETGTVHPQPQLVVASTERLFSYHVLCCCWYQYQGTDTCGT